MGFFSCRVERLFTDSETGFPSCVYCCFTTENHRSRPVRLTGNAYLIIWKVGVTSIETGSQLVTRVLKQRHTLEFLLVAYCRYVATICTVCLHDNSDESVGKLYSVLWGQWHPWSLFNWPVLFVRARINRIRCYSYGRISIESGAIRTAIESVWIKDCSYNWSPYK